MVWDFCGKFSHTNVASLTLKTPAIISKAVIKSTINSHMPTISMLTTIPDA